MNFSEQAKISRLVDIVSSLIQILSRLPENHNFSYGRKERRPPWEVDFMYNIDAFTRFILLRARYYLGRRVHYFHVSFLDRILVGVSCSLGVRSQDLGPYFYKEGLEEV